MSNPYFSFKQFTVYHHRCAMKVGIDGVLLGAWTPIENANSILDIGTGTGLIALMLAQRSNRQIDAIDIDADAIEQANENIEQSPWNQLINTHKADLQSYSKVTSKRYDLIVSNPPYFVNSTKTPHDQRTTARHTDSLTHEELIDNAVQLLNETGRICIILPVIEGMQCINYAKQVGLYCSKKVTVFPKPDAVAKRLLLEFGLLPAEQIDSDIVIESHERHRYSPEFTKLVKDFYLKL